MSIRFGLAAFVGLCVVAFGAITASAASAAGTTAFTCLPAAGSANTNTHCVPGSTGTAGDVAIPVDETTQLTVAALGTIETMVTIAGATIFVTATGAECVGCHFSNHLDASGHMDVTGSGGHLRYTGVTISTPSCKVVAEEINTEPLQFTSFVAGGVIHMEIKPVTPPTVEVVHLENNGMPCVLGTSIPMTGSFNTTLSGATTKANTGAGELFSGHTPAQLSFEFTLSGGPTGAEHHPVALTESAA